MKKTIYQRQSLSVCQPDSSPAGFKKKLNPYVLTGGILLAALILLALLVPALSPYSYETQNVEIQNAGSSLQHLFEMCIRDRYLSRRRQEPGSAGSSGI